MVLTHKELNQIGLKFLQGKYANYKYKSQIVRTELSSAAGEIPDVVGFYSGGCVIIESKTSKADFNRDKKKYHRQPSKGIGDYRFFLCKIDLISVDDLYDDWGLLYTDGVTTTIIKHPTYRGKDRSRYEDCLIMYSIMRRQEKMIGKHKD